MWPFLDKLFGLGFATERGQGWVDGASLTFGYLSFATKGPFVAFYQGMADSVIVAWAFMLGLAAIGTALLLGVVVRIAAAGGVAMLLMMYTAGAI
jgi:thiosulfate dehydrogenase [quinone] large subunit